MSPPEPVDAAVDAFYHKPMTALFRALELDAYHRAGARLPAPVLDLGCGDGAAAAMLRRRGVLDALPAWGLDLGEAAVRRAARRGAHRAVLRGDAFRLPFADGSFRGVVANGVLCAFPARPEPALAEVRRVLAPGGAFVATVPTDRLSAHLPLPRLAARVAAPRLASRLAAGFEARAEHRTVLPLEGWTGAFRVSGLEIVAVASFLGPRAAAAWGVLAFRPFRAFAALGAAPRLGRALAGPALRRGIRAVLAADAVTARDPDAGYAVIVARRG